MSAKKIIKQFYNLDLAKDDNAMSFFHKDCKLYWNSSKGFNALDYDGIEAMLQNIQKAYLSFKYKLSHLLEEGKSVTARYTIYVTPIENPDEEQPLAHFISIWEIKKGKLFKGYEISQLADEDPASLKSFLK
ncbi:nuclear transport factor 2 family protein [Subsaxibacter sp. CAU 1640]|uniref:nuclear transport factor 2 family protein n=1 Tax=Subsaxibacter sp. CAU 1640 TaxID=2933271 RepID=UPI00200686FB|nr:nuclear transport factor 2 family protein [Subsaxibacter sp. CAU 1640]MCK7591013.1 nuclear transport factor 2 family protein [Subsaxibacter sp. CAU 1640]